MGPVIATHGLTKRYGDTTAVSDLDLVIQPGEVFGLLGPNGAGKTTTILMLLGLTEPTAGDVEVVGLDPRRHPLAVKAAVGYLPDSVGFDDHLTGRQNLRYTARLNRIDPGEIEGRVADVLHVVGLTGAADQPAGEYSRGMRQRLGMADALVKRPRVLILDEPTVNIDPAGVEEILSLVRRLADEEGVAILLSSHLLHQVQAICDRIGIFVSGRMVATGTIDELAGRLDDRVILEVDAAGPPDAVLRTLEAIDGVRSITRTDDHWRIAATADLRTAVADRLHDAGCSVTHLRRASAELDAIYRRYFTGEDVTGSGDAPARRSEVAS